MNDFVYSYPTKVYFGQDAAKKAFTAELGKVGKKVMVTYGGGSVKRSGVFDEICGLLKEAGKEIVEFSGIMPNPTYAKVQEGAALAREQGVDLILGVGGGSVMDYSPAGWRWPPGRAWRPPAARRWTSSGSTTCTSTDGSCAASSRSCPCWGRAVSRTMW